MYMFQRKQIDDKIRRIFYRQHFEHFVRKKKRKEEKRQRTIESAYVAAPAVAAGAFVTCEMTPSCSM
jgi:hypothetical protein